MARLGASFPGDLGMSVTRNIAITQADMDALATLANGVGAPMPTNFRFNNFDDAVLPPTEVVGTINYGSGSYVASGTAIVCHVYSYKDVAGVNHYSKLYAIGSVTPNDSLDAFEIEWDWTPPADAVDGYIYILFATGSGSVGDWADVTSLPFTDDNNGLTIPVIGTLATWNPIEGWATRFSYLEEASGARQPGQWLRELDRIRQNMVNLYAEDATWLVSGPWCVSVGPRLRYGSDATVYGSVEFWYAADDLAGDVDFLTVAEIGHADKPYVFTTVGQPADEFHSALSPNCPAAGNWTGRIIWTTANAVSGGVTHALTAVSGATISLETWTVIDNAIILDFVLALSSGASQVDIDIDLNDGTNSFEDLSAASGRQTGEMVSEIIFDTETITPSSVDVIHPSSLGKKAAPTAIDSAFGPVVFVGVNYYPSFHVDGDVDGVWVAMTRFAYGIHTYLESDLPNYYLDSFGSGPRSEASTDPAAAAVTPAVAARSSLWPVFRDTDFGTWKRMSPSVAVTEVPYYPQDTFHVMSQVAVTAEPGGVTGYTSASIPADYEQFILRASDAAMTIYVSDSSDPIDPDNATTYDASGVGEVRLPDDFAFGGGTLWYLAKNTTETTVNFYLRRILCNKDSNGVYPGDLPDFFKKLNNGSFGYEIRSYNFPSSTYLSTYLECGKLEIPHSGYCVFEVVVSRLPVLGDNDLWEIPSTGEAALDVKLGVMLGATFDVAGTFEEFQTVTILADEPSVTTTVFWPVIGGTPLAYQSTSAVDVMAFVNFMPLVNSHFFPDYDYSSGSLANVSVHGQWSGERQTPSTARLKTGFALNGRPSDPNISDWVVLPVSAELYNDTEATLGIL